MLRDWPYEAGRLNVRIIRGDDGEPRIQVRLDLGVLQMNMEGRPDGQSPFGYGSLLEYHESRADEITGGAPSSRRERAGSGDDAPPPDDAGIPGGEPGADTEPAEFTLDAEECKALRDEAAQYYHRYVALFVLEDYQGVIRDTTRNLRLLDFCRRFGEREEDRLMLEQVRPYITMMRARAMASQAMKDNEPKVAVMAIDEGLDALRNHYQGIGEPEAFEESNEAEMLRTMRETLVPKLPVSQKAELRLRLQEALARENFELAAILRDELKLLPD